MSLRPKRCRSDPFPEEESRVTARGERKERRGEVGDEVSERESREEELGVEREGGRGE